MISADTDVAHDAGETESMKQPEAERNEPLTDVQTSRQVRRGRDGDRRGDDRLDQG